MSELEKLRALLDDVAAAKTHPAPPSPPAAGAPRGRRWTRTVWMVFIVITVLDAVYLLINALPPR